MNLPGLDLVNRSMFGRMDSENVSADDHATLLSTVIILQRPRCSTRVGASIRQTIAKVPQATI